MLLRRENFSRIIAEVVGRCEPRRRPCPNTNAITRILDHCHACVSLLRYSPYEPRDYGEIHAHLFLSTLLRPPLCLGCACRSNSFPALSNSYKAPHPHGLYFEWVTDGTPGAYQMPDEVARNGASQKELRPEVFLGAPLHLVCGIDPPPLPYASVKRSRTSTPA